MGLVVCWFLGRLLFFAWLCFVMSIQYQHHRVYQGFVEISKIAAVVTMTAASSSHQSGQLQVVLSPVVSVVSLHVGMGVGCRGSLLGLWSGLVSPLSPVVSLHVGMGVGCRGSLLGLWSGLVSPLSPVVSLHVGMGVG